MGLTRQARKLHPEVTPPDTSRVAATHLHTPLLAIIRAFQLHQGPAHLLLTRRVVSPSPLGSPFPTAQLQNQRQLSILPQPRLSHGSPSAAAQVQGQIQLR